MGDIHPDHPMVQYLNSLRTQEEGANPTYVEENRRVFVERLRDRSTWFPKDTDLQIETKLDRLVAAIVRNEVPVDLVFLTGDAGDGKTAVCAKAAAGLGYNADLSDRTTVGLWTIVKDASEVPEEDLEALIGLHLRQRNTGSKLLVAINEGRLRRLVHRSSHPSTATCHELAALREPVIERALAAWIDEDEAIKLDEAMRTERVAIVNFRHRMHIRGAVPRLLARWTQPNLWETSAACGTCSARERCPILANAIDLRDAHVQTRIADILASAHFSGQRLPFRRLQAVLAIACTGGLHCLDVQKERLAADAATMLERLQYRFYESLFHRANTRPVPGRSEPVARALAAADTGAMASFETDQEVAALASSSPRTGAAPTLGGQPLPRLEQQAIADLCARLTIPSSHARPRADLSEELAQLTRTLRRWLSLASTNAEKPWRRALALLEDYAGGGDGEPLRKRTVAAINRLHRLPARNDEQLVGRQLDPAAFRNPVRLALELELGTEFETRLRKGPVLPALVAEWLEACASEIGLEARPVGSTDGWARLRLDARLVEVLAGVDAGFSLLTSLGPYRRDLARFHAHLVTLAGKRSTARLLLRVEDKAYRLASAPGHGGGGRLRFEGQG